MEREDEEEGELCCTTIWEVVETIKECKQLCVMWITNKWGKRGFNYTSCYG